MFSIRQNGKPICTPALAFISRTELNSDSVTSKVLSLPFFVFVSISLYTCEHICLYEGKFKVSLFNVILFSLLLVNKQNLNKGITQSCQWNRQWIPFSFLGGGIHDDLHLLVSSHKVKPTCQSISAFCTILTSLCLLISFCFMHIHVKISLWLMYFKYIFFQIKPHILQIYPLAHITSKMYF